MAEKFITSRVKQRFDTLSEWQAIWETFKPLKGEVCKIQIPANTEVTGLRTSSSVRVMTKTGDGETTLALLPWDSAIGADETQLSKGTDKTASKSLSHGGTFTAITETSVSGHKVTDTTTTYTLPAETELSVDQGTATTATLSHSGTITVVSGVTKGDSGHNLDVAKTTIKLPGETAVSVDTLTAGSSTLTHGGTFTTLTAAAKGNSSHNIDVTPTKFTLPAETTISVTETEQAGSSRPEPADAQQLAFGDTIAFVDELTASGHTIDTKIAAYRLPAETTLSKGNDTNTTETLSHGGTFTAVVDTTVSGHSVSDVTKTFTLPTETAVTVDQGTATETNLSHGGTVTVLTGVTKGNTSHNIDVAKTTIKLPSETTLTKGDDAAGKTTTLSHGGTFSAVTDTSVSGHTITDTVTEFTLPAETTLTKGTDATGTATTLTHGGKFKAVTDTTVSGHTVTDVVTEFTMPSETAVSVDTLSANTKTLTHGETFTVLTAAAKGGSSHNIDVTPTTFTLPAMPTGAMIFKGTLGTGGTVTTLPTSPVAGWSYKVITAGTYGGQACTVGDMLVYDGSAWVLIPSGDDEKQGTVTSVATGQGLSGGTITTSGTIKHVDITRTDTTSSATGSHGGTVTVVDGVTTNSMGHVSSVNVKTVTLPSETTLTKGTDQSTATTPTSLTHGGTFTVMTDTSVSGHTITDKNTTFKLPSETAIVTDQLTGTAKTLTHGGTVDVITAVAKGDSGHNVDVTKTTLTLPAETAVNVTATTGSALTPAHGGKVTLVTGVAKGTNSHDVKVTTQEVQWPSQTTLTKGEDATGTAVTLAHGGTFTAMTNTTVSNHQITDTNTTFTLPAETALSIDQGTAGSSKPAHGGTVTVITGVTKGDSSHNIDVAKTTITFPSETTLTKATDATVATQTLTHGGTFTALTDLTVSGHAITDKPTTFTLPSETTLSVTDNESGNAVTDVTVSGHAITLKRGKNFLTDHPDISVQTDSTTAATLAHSGTFTAVDSVTRDDNGHVTKINTKTYTLPADSDTKNTAGGGNTSSKIYLVGVLSQATGTSYTHDTAYVGTDGCLYSGGSKVLTSYTDTKNTAGSTNTSSKIYLVGATSQAANPQTYSHDTAYVGTDGCLYSNSTKVSVEGHVHSVATASTNGFMSAGDKQNLDSVVNATNLLVNSAGEVTIKSSATMPELSTLGKYLLNNGAYTVRITFDAKSDVATNVDVYPRNSSGAMTQHTSLFSISTSWNTYSGTVVLPKGAYTAFTIRSNSSVSGGSSDATVNIKNIVLTIDYADTGHTHSVTAVGTVSKPTFSGTAASHNHTFNGTEAGHLHTFTGTAANHKHTFTGTAHDHTFTGTAVTSGGASATTSIYQITGVGTAASHTYTPPSLTASVTNQCLTLTWSAGSHSFTANTVPTRSAVTVATAHTHSVTAAGTVESKTAGGTIADTSVTPAGTIGETKITPAGTIANTSITPAGTISQPTFTGTAVTSGSSST